METIAFYSVATVGEYRWQTITTLLRCYLVYFMFDQAYLPVYLTVSDAIKLVYDQSGPFNDSEAKMRFSCQCKGKTAESTWPRCLISEISFRSFNGKGLNPDAFVVAVSFGNYCLLAIERCIRNNLKRILLRTCPHNPNRSIVLPEAAATGMAIYGQGIDKNLPRVCIMYFIGTREHGRSMAVNS
jgi:hypothetical protein